LCALSSEWWVRGLFEWKCKGRLWKTWWNRVFFGVKVDWNILRTLQLEPIPINASEVTKCIFVFLNTPSEEVVQHNPGLVPDVKTMRSGEIGKRRKGTYEVLVGCWRSCIEAGDGNGPPVFAFQAEDFLSTGTRPFIADAIIANPPSFVHIHCAEKLGIPLHLMFAIPWSPTQSFPHPLANVKSTNADRDRTNFMSYALVEMMTWQGLGDIINTFRHKILNLQPMSLMWAPGLSSRLRIPFTYCW
jgi:hypothetical protein